MKKTIGIVLTLVMMIGSTLTATAATSYGPWGKVITPSQLGQSFKKSWEVKAYEVKITCGDVEMYCIADIGYDTWWTKEDYIDDVGGVSNGFMCKGIVRNSKGENSGTGWILDSGVSGYRWVEHTGDRASYYFIIDTSR